MKGEGDRREGGREKCGEKGLRGSRGNGGGAGRRGRVRMRVELSKDRRRMMGRWNKKRVTM